MTHRQAKIWGERTHLDPASRKLYFIRHLHYFFCHVPTRLNISGSVRCAQHRSYCAVWRVRESRQLLLLGIFHRNSFQRQSDCITDREQPLPYVRPFFSHTNPQLMLQLGGILLRPPLHRHRFPAPLLNRSLSAIKPPHMS